MATKKEPASDLPKLAAPAQRALAGAGVRDLSDLKRMTEADVMALHGMGPNALNKLRDALKEKGLSFAPEQEPGFPRAIGNPATNALNHAGYTKLEQLTTLSEKQLRAMHGVGPKAIGILREELKARGLSFAD